MSRRRNGRKTGDRPGVFGLGQSQPSDLRVGGWAYSFPSMLRHFVIIGGLLLLPVFAFAGDMDEKPFVKKRYSIEGSAKIETTSESTQLVFSDDFKTKNGPDLKVYLSKIPLSELSEKDVDGDAIRLSVLKSHRGAQSYTLPTNIDISDYQSVVIQCEAYSVLWGGFDL